MRRSSKTFFFLFLYEDTNEKDIFWGNLLACILGQNYRRDKIPKGKNYRRDKIPKGLFPKEQKKEGEEKNSSSTQAK